MEGYDFTPEPWEAGDLDNPNICPHVFIGPKLKYAYLSGSRAFRDYIVIDAGPSAESVEKGERLSTATKKTLSANARLIEQGPVMFRILCEMLPYLKDEQMGEGERDVFENLIESVQRRVKGEI